MTECDGSYSCPADRHIFGCFRSTVADDRQGGNVKPLPKHQLTHYKLSNGTLTPGCTCGWWSGDRKHSDFERHIRRVTDKEET